jgi:RHS repeat-associated protein
MLLPLDGGEPEQTHYSAFGEETGSRLSPWRFSSKRVDEKNNLVYYGRRFYQPELGRWLSPDPAGFTDGMNLYAFVHNDPLTHFDEYGLFMISAPPWLYQMDSVHRFGKDAPSYYRPIINTALKVWNNLRFQGSMQAIAGCAEASAGATLAVTPFAPLGVAMLAHGADHFAAGSYAVFTGRHRTTLTEQLLQKTGMSPEWASFSNNLLSVSSFTSSIGLARNFAYQSSRILSQAAMNSNQATEQILFGQKSVSAFFSEIGTFKSKPISEVVQGLRNGTISPDSLPIEIILRNGQKITLNNRSLVALRRASIEPTVIIDRTGIPQYERLLNRHLKGSTPSDVIKIRGGPSDTSLTDLTE